nr:class I SAM-dependent methyltransferase [Micromonospora sp. DSM 115978]
MDPAEYGEKIADVYDEWLGAQAEGFGRDTAAEVEFLAARAAGGPALELGIGTGRVALPLAARGVRVVGIDSSPKMVDRMRAKPGGADLPVVIGDFAELDAHVDVPEGTFQLVYVVFNTLFGLLTQADQLRCFDG